MGFNVSQQIQYLEGRVGVVDGCRNAANAGGGGGGRRPCRNHAGGRGCGGGGGSGPRRGGVVAPLGVSRPGSGVHAAVGGSGLPRGARPGAPP